MKRIWRAVRSFILNSTANIILYLQTLSKANARNLLPSMNIWRPLALLISTAPNWTHEEPDAN
jgi:hypothetical protein